jgi:hypothetical protein
MGLNISTDTSIITSTIATDIMDRFLPVENIRWSIIRNFTGKPCMTRMAMRLRADVGSVTDPAI